MTKSTAQCTAVCKLMWTTMGVESNKKYANEALTICKKVRMWVNFFMRKNKIRHKLAKVSTVIFTCALSTEERLKEISISLLELLYHESFFTEESTRPAPPKQSYFPQLLQMQVELGYAKTSRFMHRIRSIYFPSYTKKKSNFNFLRR